MGDSFWFITVSLENILINAAVFDAVRLRPALLVRRWHIITFVQFNPRHAYMLRTESGESRPRHHILEQSRPATIRRQSERKQWRV